MINWPIEQPTLKTTFADSVIVLRPLREEDIEPTVHACQDPTISAFTRVPFPYEREHAEDFVRSAAINYLNHKAVVFAIEVDGIFAGAIDLHSISLGDHCAEIGYWVEKSHRGKGICTAAVKLLSDFALNIMALRRLEALADFDNVASQKVMASAGMVLDAVLKNKVTKPDGRQIDMALYSMIKN